LKINKIVATRCHILKLKCTKFYFRWGFAPEPAGGLEITALPDLLAGFKGSTSRGKKKGKRRGQKGKATSYC